MKAATGVRIGIILFFILLIVGVYFWVHGHKADDLTGQKAKIEGDLAVVQAKLDTEKIKLQNITNTVYDAYSSSVSIQDQMKKATKIVNKTDFMFSDASGLNPQIIIKNLKNGSIINNERRDLNVFILRWQNEINITSVDKIDINEIEKIRQEAEAIKKFIEDLSNIVASLTPVNSGFSQFEIDIFASQLPKVGSMDEIISAIEDEIQNYKDSNNSDSGSSSNTPPVTPEDLIKQQELVDQTQNQVDVLQQQLNDINIQENPPPVDTTTDTTPPVDSTPANTDTVNHSFDKFIAPSALPNSGPQEDIVIQPGPPRLIEGSNKY